MYAIDSDEKLGRETVLTMLGHSLEKFLTSTPEEFARYRMGSEELPTDNPNSAELSYHYAEVSYALIMAVYLLKAPLTNNYVRWTSFYCDLNWTVKTTGFLAKPLTSRRARCLQFVWIMLTWRLEYAVLLATWVLNRILLYK